MPHLSPINWIILLILFWVISILFLTYNWWYYNNNLIVVYKLKKTISKKYWYEISIIFSTCFFQKSSKLSYQNSLIKQ